MTGAFCNISMNCRKQLERGTESLVWSQVVHKILTPTFMILQHEQKLTLILNFFFCFPSAFIWRWIIQTKQNYHFLLSVCCFGTQRKHIHDFKLWKVLFQHKRNNRRTGLFYKFFILTIKRSWYVFWNKYINIDCAN